MLEDFQARASQDARAFPMMRDYPSILHGMLRLGRWEATWTPGASVCVELGAAYAASVIGQREAGEEAMHVLNALSPSVRPVPVLDRQGHRRLEYEGLVLYALAQAIRLNPPIREPSARDALSSWGRALAQRDRLAFSGPIPASQGAAVTGQIWNGLAMQAIGLACNHPAFRDHAALVFGDLVQRQTLAGTFLKTSATDNPETHWYHELVLLHAVNSYAVLSGDASAKHAARRSAEFHLTETQPDHATHQPWALAAFLRHPDSMVRGMGEGMLHAARALDGVVGSALSTDRPHALTPWGLTSILLADALYCLTS